MRLAIFDLDYTVWKPEMYQLYGQPKLVPRDENSCSAASSTKRNGRNKYKTRGLATIDEQLTRTTKPGMILVDSQGQVMEMFPGAIHALKEIEDMKAAGQNVQAAVASRTDEPKWAHFCMQHMVIDEDNTTLQHCFGNLIEIAFGSKVQHITRLHKQTGIDYADMCFFDNERWNIQTVSKSLPEVKCYYTPDGMTKQAWEQAKRDFGM